ncbi:nucleotidyltransferase domain-containing protein [Carboxydocella sp. ULO1]|uniref:type VII toxin-antitoxin system MntA family adenylyltransferase antitoxin n=1 Tax=Carboxydocella sp. ULO1 TaxID=1926599 RepID=UPI0009AECE3E|nr:nucleotidyltransferase domain-containing protein [Carboxydocella sp. ULO1]GAW29330.1 DNA polymerase subunit beta [Carboxydocella sp. ULO1]
MQGLGEKEIKLIINFLQERVNPLFILLFGSAAQDRLRADSDIDLAFLAEQKTEAWYRYQLAQELAELLQREVDLVDLREASTVLTAQIVGTGKIVFSRDEIARQWFFMRALKEYALLNERRQVILEAIKKRGRVYGEGCDYQ